MKNNILGGLVIFMVVVTCLLMIDDFTNPQQETIVQETEQIEQSKDQTDLAIVETEE
ncbi:hypothetical protein [Winogradskyella sp. PG-2]|uniref:hypothetical protein n=1 Tax=Winogradskyella sp. PG-2 TaxID=754409 RepID=UPI0004588AF1|nr:hypothetical protein [Winogradskyella sp. PG-2]BAO75242.1 hypothetical protein WPG_1012 [Winogradskyella sp. PG-2]